MGREGPVLYCMDNTGALGKYLIPKEKLFSIAGQPVNSRCAMPPLSALLVMKSLVEI